MLNWNLKWYPSNRPTISFKKGCSSGSNLFLCPENARPGCNNFYGSIVVYYINHPLKHPPIMKQFFAIVFMLAITSAAFSQSSLPKPTAVAPQAAGAAKAAQGFDVKSIANSIMGNLTPALGLSAVQKPSVQTAVTGFLKDKSGILGLAKTDKAAYATKFSGLQNGLFGKLKSILSVAQYTKFLGLKPKTNDATNALSQLFF
jgi:hypothetical protein